MDNEKFQNLMLEQMAAMMQSMTMLTGDVKGLKEDVNILKEDVKGLKEDVNILKEDVKGLKEDVNILKDDVKNLKSDVVRIETKLDEKTKALYDGYVLNHEKLEVIEIKIDKLTDKVDRHDIKIQVIEGSKKCYRE
jgi:chromosome segregation ATPase